MFVEKVSSLLDDFLTGRPDLFLIDFSVSENNAIKVIIDGDKGVSVEDCVAVSRAIEHNLDRDEVDGGGVVVDFPLGTRQGRQESGCEGKGWFEHRHFQGLVPDQNDNILAGLHGKLPLQVHHRDLGNGENQCSAGGQLSGADPRLM